MTPRVLVVDDEERMASVVAMALGRAGMDCETCSDGAAALRALETRGADVVVTDWKMAGMDGMELLRRLRRDHPAIPVILITAFASVPSAVAAMREGAFDYVTKPFDNDELRAVVSRALEMTRLERENRWLRQELATRYDPDAMIAASPQSRALLELVRRVAPARSTVLIQGESGTGKELVARLLHYWSERVGKPFVAVNCKAFGEGVLESELFGHARGAFTGAVAARAGCFQRAAGGTLFLDEIGEVSPAFQAKLLRVLQDGEVLPVGGSRPVAVDVRVVAATNRVLRDEVAAGRFREDLFFRLNVIPVHLAPLRERPDDVLPLARHFLGRHAAEVGRRLAFSAETEAALAAHPWPGNVRELENAVERAVVLARGDVITPEDLLLSESIAGAGGGRAAEGAAAAEGATGAGGGGAAGENGGAPVVAAAPEDGGAAGAGTSAGEGRGPGVAGATAVSASPTLQESLDAAAADRIRAALAAAHGQRAEAARALGIDRTTLYRLMKRLGIHGL